MYNSILFLLVSGLYRWRDVEDSILSLIKTLKKPFYKILKKIYFPFFYNHITQHVMHNKESHQEVYE